MGPEGKLAVLMFAAGLTLGCLGAPGASVTPAEETPATSRPVVVAVIDSGANPYHEAFQPTAGGLPVDDHLQAFPSAQLVKLTDEGDFEARMEKDSALWDGLETGKLYAFSGTRLLGISISATPGQPIILDMVGHGAGTSSLVAREAPESIVLLVQIDGGGCLPTQECPLLPDAAAAMRWVAEQPWIDIVSVSIGVPGGPPTHAAQSPEIAAYLEASALAHARGKLILNAGGNTPTVSFFDYFAGPPWIIAVGGFSPSQKGDTLESARFIDVVANFTDRVATRRSVDEYGTASGTSYGTPIVAGTLARSMHLVQKAGALDVPPGAFRDALNATAVYSTPADWEPTNGTAAQALDRVTLTAPIVHGPLQTGWGYVHGGLAEAIAAYVLADDNAIPAAKLDAAQHQGRVQSLREAYWGIAARGL